MVITMLLVFISIWTVSVMVGPMGFFIFKVSVRGGVGVRARVTFRVRDGFYFPD